MYKKHTHHVFFAIQAATSTPKSTLFCQIFDEKSLTFLAELVYFVSSLTELTLVRRGNNLAAESYQLAAADNSGNFTINATPFSFADGQDAMTVNAEINATSDVGAVDHYLFIENTASTNTSIIRHGGLRVETINRDLFAPGIIGFQSAKSDVSCRTHISLDRSGGMQGTNYIHYEIIPDEGSDLATYSDITVMGDGVNHGNIEIPYEYLELLNFTVTLTAIEGHALLDETNATTRPYISDEPCPSAPYCFIATAAYGTSMNAQLDALRSFKNNVLLQSTFGEYLVTTYYRYSPPIAQVIAQHGWMRASVRAILTPIIAIISHPWLLAPMLLLLTALPLAIVRRRQAQQSVSYC